MHQPTGSRLVSSLIELYCHKVIPFYLKNVDVTYQRFVNKLSTDQVDKMMQVYIDDMLVKSKTKVNLITHLENTFQTL